MKVTRAQADENRNRIIDVAGRLFRERGLDGVGIAEVMKEAGLTHGGFYGNFRSKEELVALASARAIETTRRRLAALAETAGGHPFAAIVRQYVSGIHRDSPGAGCTFATLAQEAARQGGAVRSVFTAGLRSYLDMLARLVPGRSAAARRRRALSALSEMVGAIVLSRAVDDPELSDEILEATIASLIDQASRHGPPEQRQH